MNGAHAQRIKGGRLHLQHGPIDLVIGVDGARDAAFAAAQARFSSVLEELVSELPVLRSAMPVTPKGAVAQRMARAARWHSVFATPMIAVAGAVADEILTAIRDVGDVQRAYVNNGGDIAVYLGEGQRFSVGVAGVNNHALAKITLRSGDGIGGVASSGRAGRSLSMGIADNVTVLAACAAEADAAATLIANAVDVQDGEHVVRARACDLDPDSDLGARLVVTECGVLGARDVAAALDAGATFARILQDAGRISAAFLVLQGEARVVGRKELIDA